MALTTKFYSFNYTVSGGLSSTGNGSGYLPGWSGSNNFYTGPKPIGGSANPLQIINSVIYTPASGRIAKFYIQNLSVSASQNLSLSAIRTTPGSFSSSVIAYLNVTDNYHGNPIFSLGTSTNPLAFISFNGVTMQPSLGSSGTAGSASVTYVGTSAYANTVQKIGSDFSFATSSRYTDNLNYGYLSSGQGFGVIGNFVPYFSIAAVGDYGGYLSGDIPLSVNFTYSLSYIYNVSGGIVVVEEATS